MRQLSEGLIVVIILIIALMIFGMVGCNYQMVDLTYSFERAVMSLPNGGFIEGEVDSWMDYENSDQIQIVIDGVTYLTHISNVVLISE